MRYGIAPGWRRCGRIFRQVGVLTNRHPNQFQSRVGSKISLRFLALIIIPPTLFSPGVAAPLQNMVCA